MIILTDCLTSIVDEGCLKIANNLAERIKRQNPNTLLVSYGRDGKGSDLHIKLNKFFLNKVLFNIIHKESSNILYIPFASNTLASCIRVWILSLISEKKVSVLFALYHPMNIASKMFLKMSKADIITLSSKSYKQYYSNVGNTVRYIKTGIDTSRFVPVDKNKKEQLRDKYKIQPGKKMILHVGHMNRNRNIQTLLNISIRYHIFLVISSTTKEACDMKLRQELQEKENITIIDSYLEHIEELYQAADVYFFPVYQDESCIDIPLSVLEAAACNIPIVATKYGELENFLNEPGFFFLSSFTSQHINEALDKMAGFYPCNNRNAVLEYDWQHSVKHLVN